MRIRLAVIVNTALVLLLGTVLALAVRLAATGAKEAAHQVSDARSQALARILESTELSSELANVGRSFPVPGMRYLSPYLVHEISNLDGIDNQASTNELSFQNKECFLQFSAPSGSQPIAACAALPSNRLRGYLYVGVGFCSIGSGANPINVKASQLETADHFALRITDNAGFERLWRVYEEVDPNNTKGQSQFAFYPWSPSIGDPSKILPDQRLTGRISDATTSLVSCQSPASPRFAIFHVDLRCLMFERTSRDGEPPTAWLNPDNLCNDYRRRIGWWDSSKRPASAPLKPDLIADDEAFTSWSGNLRIEIDQQVSRNGGRAESVASTVDGTLIPPQKIIDRPGKPLSEQATAFANAILPGESLEIGFGMPALFTWRFGDSPETAGDKGDHTWDKWIDRLLDIQPVVSRLALQVNMGDPSIVRHFTPSAVSLQFRPRREVVKAAIYQQLSTHSVFLAAIGITIIAVLILVNALLLRPLVRLARAATKMSDEPISADLARLPYQDDRNEVGDVARAFADLLNAIRDQASLLQQRFFEATEAQRRDNFIFEQEKKLWPIIAHEIRSPAHTLSSELEMRGTEEDLLRLRHVRRIATAMEVIDKLRSGEALDASSASFELSNFCKVWIANADEKYLPLEARPLQPSAPVCGSVELTDMIIDNLISNANRYRHPEDAPIILETDAEGGFGIVRVINPGSPIPDDRIPYIFALNYSDGPKRTKQNKGIGLFISRHYAELMNGTLDVLPSTSGAIFELRIPLDIKLIGAQQPLGS